MRERDGGSWWAEKPHNYTDNQSTVSENVEANLLAQVRSGSYQVSKALRNKSKAHYQSLKTQMPTVLENAFIIVPHSNSLLGGPSWYHPWIWAPSSNDLLLCGCLNTVERTVSKFNTWQLMYEVCSQKNTWSHSLYCTLLFPITERCLSLLCAYGVK